MKIKLFLCVFKLIQHMIYKNGEKFLVLSNHLNHQVFYKISLKKYYSKYLWCDIAGHYMW